MKKNVVLDGIMGLVVGDALGVPVQFLSRSEIANRSQGPVTGMEGFGTFNLPAGSWSDDSSMSLATLDSIKIHNGIDLDDIMLRFINWNMEGAYTPYGFSYDQGITCTHAMDNYMSVSDAHTCGITGEYANGNGALMRILPVCLYNILNKVDTDTAIKSIHDVTALTHNHLRSKICSGFYYFIAKEIIESVCGGDDNTQNNITVESDSDLNNITSDKSLNELVQSGIDAAYAYYKENLGNLTEVTRLGRIFNTDEFKQTSVDAIKSTGYVIDTIEAVIWCLVTTNTYEACMLKAVNLGDDTDTVAAIAGGLAGLYYGYENIPEEWIAVVAKRDWIESVSSLEYVHDFPLADTHIHAVYDVDDGSTSLEMSLEMIDNEYKQGVRTIVMTSHNWANEREHYNERFDNLVKLCADKYPDLKLCTGCEIYCERGWMNKNMRELESGLIHTMNNTKYVLAEFDNSMDMDNVIYCCNRLFEKGYIPIIAHAERYYDVFDGLDSVKLLKDMGCLVQINAYSLANDSNEKARNLAREIIYARLADFLGSDAHRMNHRPPQMADGIAWLLRKAEREYVEAVSYKNVMKYLDV